MEEVNSTKNNSQPTPPLPTRSDLKPIKKSILKSSLFWIIIIIIGFFTLCFLLFAGYFGRNLYKNYSSIAKQSPTPTLSNASKDIVDQILNWQSYENNEFGFSIKYPSKYKLNEINKESETLGGITSKYGISIIGEDYFIIINTADNPNNLTSKEVINNIIAELTKKRIAYNKISTGNEPYDYYGSIIQGIQLTSRNYKLGDINGTLFDYGGMDHSQQYIYVTVNNKIYEIVFSDLDGQIVSENARKEIDKILSTFRLIDNTNPIPNTPKPSYNKTEMETFNVPKDQLQATFSVSWDRFDGDVKMIIETPSGRIIDENTKSNDVRLDKTETYEIFSIQYPEPGEWEISYAFTNVPPGGVDYTIGGTTIPKPSQ